MIKELDDKFRFYGYVRQDRGAAPDPEPEAAFHCLEVTKESSANNFITFGVKRHMSQGAIDKMADIMPDPGYHDPGVYHLDGNMAEWSGSKLHYHLNLSRVPTAEDVWYVIERLEALGKPVYTCVKDDIEGVYPRPANLQNYKPEGIFIDVSIQE